MKLFNQLFNNKIIFLDKLSILLFSLLPISMIIGNASININILLIDFLFLIYCIKFRLWSWLKRDVFLYLVVFYIFLNLNSLYSYSVLFENKEIFFWADHGVVRSFLFIKFILLVFAFSVLLKDDKILGLVHKSWFFIIIIVIFDVFFERFIGRNILGNISIDSTRLVSFFKDETVVGGFIYCFGFASTAYFINNNDKNKSILPLMLIFLLLPLSIFVTGEKSNFIKSIFFFFIMIYFFKRNKYNLDYRILVASLIFLIICLFTFNKNLRIKYTETYERIMAVENLKKEIGVMRPKTIFDKMEQIKYFSHYAVAIKIFKNHPISGVGNKKFRVECSKEKYFDKDDMWNNFRCSTHPHQVHLEILSEHGILGYFLILCFITWFSIKNFKIALKNKDVYHLSNTSYVLIFFIPLLPTGGIFSTFSGSLFWVIFSLVNLNYDKK